MDGNKQMIQRRRHPSIGGTIFESNEQAHDFACSLVVFAAAASAGPLPVEADPARADRRADGCNDVTSQAALVFIDS